MLRRRVDRVDFQRNFSDIDDVVPCSRRHDDRKISVDVPPHIPTVFISAHHHVRKPAFDPQKLIVIGMHFKPDISSDGNAHERYLQVISRPQRGSEKRIDLRGSVNVHGDRLRSAIPDRKHIFPVSVFVQTDHLRYDIQ